MTKTYIVFLRDHGHSIGFAPAYIRHHYSHHVRLAALRILQKMAREVQAGDCRVVMNVQAHNEQEAIVKAKSS